MQDSTHYKQQTILKLALWAETITIHQCQKRKNQEEENFKQLFSLVEVSKKSRVRDFVEWAQQQEVEISFLPVGHTHNDVDQLFSRISVATEKSGCLTPEDLLRIIQPCHKQTQGEASEAGAQPQYVTMENLYATRSGYYHICPFA
ncbi:hypothetical protein ACROYT_G015555 [Oculina patagonica]